MGAFDDLIPQGQKPAPKAVRSAAGGAFDDLVPAKPRAVAAPKPKPAPRPSLFRMDSDFTKRAGLSQFDLAVPALKDMFGSRQGAAEALAKKTGGRVEVDERGEPVLQLPSGERYRLNDEGFDSTDVANFAGNALAFLTPAGWAARLSQARNVGLLGRSALQAGTAAGTDAALQATFDNGRINPVRTAMAAAGGGAGEVAGTGLGLLMRRLQEGTAKVPQVLEGVVENAPPVRKAAVAREAIAGTDPRALIGREQYGFVYSQGQRATDPTRKFDLLSREEVLRQNPLGGAPFRRAADTNAERLDVALTDLTERLGGRAGATPAELAQGAASRVSQQAEELGTRIQDAYAEAAKGNRAAISKEAVLGLPRRIQQSLADFAPNPSTTPAAAKTLEQIKTATESIAKMNEGSVAGVTLKALEIQRRIINNNIAAASNPADRAAVTKIKREFDTWLDEAVDTSLISGDPNALKALKEARGLRAEFGRRFEGGADTDRFIAGLLDGSRTPEELVNIALGASQVSKAGGARFIERLRQAAGDDPAVVGNLRAAHFLRMTRGPNGEALPMGQIVRNIASTDFSNASIVRALYGQKEWAEIKRLASALEPLVAKGDFARTSGTAERMARMMFQRIGGGMPVIGELVQQVGNVKAAIQAERAISQPLRLPVRPVPVQGAFSALGQQGAPAMQVGVSGGTRGAWTPEDDAELERLRAEMVARRMQHEGR